MSNEKSFHFETFFTFHKNTGNYKIFVIALEKVKNFASWEQLNASFLC